jgi:IS30 family transposase
MSGYCHLSLDERFAIARLHEAGRSRRSIAEELGRSPSTIKRELARNSNADGRYRPRTAEARYLARRAKVFVLDRLDDLAHFVVERLHENWTPEQIAGWLKAGAEQFGTVSHEAIYAWIYGRSQRQAKLWRLLPRRKGKRGFRPARKPRIAIKDRNSIHDRPEAVDDRAEGGHWEGDLLICKKTRPVLVLTERKSRFTIAAKLNSKNAEETATAIMRIFQRLDPSLRRSATFDNDTAFAKHGLLRQALELATWFCDAYASWQKGAVENINGRLRRDLPRRIDIDKLSDDELQDILLMHNLTPRKCLSFKTPAQALLQQLGLNVKISFNRGVALQF